jgi:hypothetical protein
MPGIARQFEPQITRTGGAPSKYRFTARCSGCPKTDSYEASKPAGDELVKGYFKGSEQELLPNTRRHYQPKTAFALQLSFCVRF